MEKNMKFLEGNAKDMHVILHQFFKNKYLGFWFGL
jgi:hypothetical protein